MLRASSQRTALTGSRVHHVRVRTELQPEYQLLTLQLKPDQLKNYYCHLKIIKRKQETKRMWMKAI